MSKELQVNLSRRLMRRYNYNVYRKRKYETVRYRRYKKPSNNFLDLIYNMWEIITYIIGSIIYYICMLVCSSFGGMKTYTPVYSYSSPYY